MTGTAPSPSISTGLSRDRFTEKPLIHEESFKKPSLPLGSEYRGSLVGSSSVGKRGAGREAIPNASQLLQQKPSHLKHAVEYKNNTIPFKSDEKWRSNSLLYPSSQSIDVTTRRRISHASEIPEDPLLDGAFEDAVLAGQPVLHSHSSPRSQRRFPSNQNISTAMLFTHSSHQN
ncbi:hypothetical protein PSTG_00516 [Puccinia striiformis f. sp. tritici PST-78]|uniref:Uncharacterized protein n=1 Tax=Puccinia striiformis f. sp. tritici PST-78 TaxID=1165861 RepID=A0A0L0W597_9BASI|nr:hypothetical protein PSTG_00516 [Puccinia striiformis f. sp. tritici PST-78]